MALLQLATSLISRRFVSIYSSSSSSSSSSLSPLACRIRWHAIATTNPTSTIGSGVVDASSSSCDVAMGTTDFLVVPSLPTRVRGRMHATAISSSIRNFSSVPSSTSAAPPPTPSSLSAEAGLGAQEVMKFYILHGLGRQKLQSIASDVESTPLVERWQRMISAYLEAQCNVIGLLGYPPDERGISMYTQQMQRAMSISPPDVQEKLRTSMRDTYRHVLAGAFDMPKLLEEQGDRGELSIMDARNIMHRVSLRMMEPEILDRVRERCDGISTNGDDSAEGRQVELARRHTVVQEIMVADVYLSPSSSDGSGSTTTLVEEFGFGSGESGYVRMQCALAEHQGDPLITQYVGAAIVRLLECAGIDMEAMQKQARELQQTQ
ncbi:hypothetical protein ACHAXA_005996 [Cyclostephanos tholiformis]|uniref:Uncharacterized protein n=1 Tax=Cyclostephanos tholiformis TaxID=382380 RepID=A0ABD3SRD2_9STRA